MLPEKEANINTIDMITSKDSTFPFDDDTTRRMIRLVKAAKGTPVCCKQEKDR